ncbi:C-type lectin BfL-2-like [Patiria miniata]|uniref:C-type lectin domain-containing protein n=1 Tax=Patiria miniata TaxID=46514 RepID=A0A913Z3W7_PATMI|nr:C-type lectin BfL-2-like [Patiria miniata]
MNALILATILVATTSQLVHGACPEAPAGENPWRQTGCRCYMAVNRLKNWYDASNDCTAMGGQLATLGEGQKSDLRDVISNDMDFNTCSSVLWLGFTEKDRDDTEYFSLDGTTGLYNWLTNEPKNTPNEYDCASVHFGGGWLSYPCITTHCYACETASI